MAENDEKDGAERKQPVENRICPTMTDLHADEAFCQRIFREFRGRAEFQLPLDAGLMKFHGLDCHMQNRGDFLGAPAFGDQLQHFALSRSQSRG